VTAHFNIVDAAAESMMLLVSGIGIKTFLMNK
jgi:hypothetical protein